MSLRRKDTPESRAYWEFVEKTAASVEADCKARPWMRPYVKHFLCGQFCRFGDGTQTCRAVNK